MFHSIIIPHRNRNDHLAICLWSINCSAEIVKTEDYEVLVVDGGEKPINWTRPHVLTVSVPLLPTLFNKCWLLNEGIKRARGDVLTFLDADSIVGPAWMENVEKLRDPSLTKLAYRVRFLRASALEEIRASTEREKLITSWFHRYDTSGFQRRAENYGYPERHVPAGEEPSPIGHHVFGNSQFSITREKLGDLRFDAENFSKSGYEDIDMNARIWEKYGEQYLCEIIRDGPHAILDIPSTRGPDWFDAKSNERQHDYYFRRCRRREDRLEEIA